MNIYLETYFMLNFCSDVFSLSFQMCYLITINEFPKAYQLNTTVAASVLFFLITIKVG